MRKRMNHKRRSAFTLIEILLVAGILAVLAAFAIPNLLGQAERAKKDLTKAAILKNGSIGKALDAYRFDMGKYPDTDEGLAALAQPKEKKKDDPRYSGPYIEISGDQLRDPWTNPYHYRSPGEVNTESYDLWSSGPDGKDDNGKEGSDDVKNWVEK